MTNIAVFLDSAVKPRNDEYTRIFNFTLLIVNFKFCNYFFIYFYLFFCLLPTPYCLLFYLFLPTAYSLLLTIYFFLPTAYSLLLTVYFFLPTAYCLLLTVFTPPRISWQYIHQPLLPESGTRRGGLLCRRLFFSFLSGTAGILRLSAKPLPLLWSIVISFPSFFYLPHYCYLTGFITTFLRKLKAGF